MKRVVIAAAAALLALPLTATQAEARSCPPASVGGRTVGEVKLPSRTVPLKSVTFANGGTLNPPATNLAAGVSKRNAPLGAKKGTTIITWHVRYGSGCNGALNPLLRMPMGSTFTVSEVGKPPRTYKITKRFVVPKTGLKSSWFRKNGPHRLVLLTCADLVGGVFRKTEAVIAAPVRTPPVPAKPVVPAAPTTPQE
jgi:sortase (surface protein transpeptidase)